VGRDRFERSLDALLRAPDEFIGAASQTVDDASEGLRRGDPRRRLADVRRRITEALARARAAGPRAIDRAFSRWRIASSRLTAGFKGVALSHRSAFDITHARLNALGPRATLARGYAIIYDERGRVITDAAATAAGNRIGVTLRRGGLTATVAAIEETND
jgi:exodeoxyribonuclease VII large subunit